MAAHRQLLIAAALIATVMALTGDLQYEDAEDAKRSPLGTMRFGKRSPLGTMRFGKRAYLADEGVFELDKKDFDTEAAASQVGNRDIRSPLGTMRFGKRSPLGTMRFGKRNPLGTMRFGKRSNVMSLSEVM